MIVITGGLGFIGSHIAAVFLERLAENKEANKQKEGEGIQKGAKGAEGEEVLIIDRKKESNVPWALKSKLATQKGVEDKIYFEYCDIFMEREKLIEVFQAYAPISAVIHCAALKSIAESFTDPLSYYATNVGGTRNVLKAMEAVGCNTILYSSSAAVYGEPFSRCIAETHPKKPSSPYGKTKLAGESMLECWEYAKKEEKRVVVILRYFNPIGAHSSGLLGEEAASGSLQSVLMEVIRPRSRWSEAWRSDSEDEEEVIALRQKEADQWREEANKRELKVFGGDYDTEDGTCVRDFVHVMDLAEAHLLVLDRLQKKEVETTANAETIENAETKSGVAIFNLGSEKGTSVLELKKAFEEASGQQIPFFILPRREGDVAEVCCDASEAKVRLGWQAKRSVQEACADTWNFLCSGASCD